MTLDEHISNAVAAAQAEHARHATMTAKQKM